MDLSVERIGSAAQRIPPVFVRSPQFVSERLSTRLGCELLVKVETMNPIGSFKGRGTWLLAQELDPDSTWVCSTAGNFGQGLAYAARPLGAQVHAFVAPDAPHSKVEGLRSLGATVTVERDAGAAAAAFATSAPDRVLVVDGSRPAIAEGAGSIAVELESAGPFDTAVIQLGDGALISGVACWLKARHPTTQVVGVCAAGAPAMATSFAARRAVPVNGPGTIATALSVTHPLPESVARVVALVDDVVTVDDDDLRRAMKEIADTFGVLVEPAGAAGIAAVARHRDRLRGRRVAVLLTGAA